jgi:hypothetical protein
MRIIFCDNLIDRKVDPDFEEECLAASKLGFTTSLLSFEELNDLNFYKATQKIKKAEVLQLAIYRGWMIPADKYIHLYEYLLKKNIKLINTPEEYETCHYLPLAYQYIHGLTPQTNWMVIDGDINFEDIFALTDTFKAEAIIVKDFVKSQKHNWEDACFIPNASDKDSVRKIVSRFIELQGTQLNKGLVFRKFENLEFLTNHSKSKMPLTKEFRLFFLYGKLIQVFNYWDEGDYDDIKPDFENFKEVGSKVNSNFFTMDVAQKKDGDWIIMELGDGQVSGLPDNADKIGFYKALKESFL